MGKFKSSFPFRDLIQFKHQPELEAPDFPNIAVERVETPKPKSSMLRSMASLSSMMGQRIVIDLEKYSQD